MVISDVVLITPLCFTIPGRDDGEGGGVLRLAIVIDHNALISLTLGELHAISAREGNIPSSLTTSGKMLLSLQTKLRTATVIVGSNDWYMRPNSILASNGHS